MHGGAASSGPQSALKRPKATHAIDFSIISREDGRRHRGAAINLREIYSAPQTTSAGL